MSRAKRRKKKPKKLVLGDDAIESFEADWFDFRTPAIELAKQLYMISKSSGVCCGIVGPWGSGKSSFMKLMEEYIRKESSWKKVHIAWFTAWDPGGIQDLGDAMLYHFFRDAIGKNQEMAGAFKELQKALGIRRSLRERASRALEDVSKTLPTTGRTAATVASSLLRELDAPRKVQRCFEKLMGWLEKEKRTVFFFIDDIDRATGDQIRDLLSELKLYISHRRIVAVLGYDEDYVLNALKSPVLPPGIDPKKYLEKIVTVRRNVPIPTYMDLTAYATRLIHSMSDLAKHAERLGLLATTLSSNNPRRLKNLVLSFTQLVSSVESKHLSFEDLESSLVTTTAANMGFLGDDKIRDAVESGDEGAIISAIQGLVEKDPPKSKEAEILIDAVKNIRPKFRPGMVTLLRLDDYSKLFPGVPPRPYRIETFDWSTSFITILSSAAMQGFKLPHEHVVFSGEIVIPPSTKTESLGIKYKEQPERIQRLLKPLLTHGCVLSWNQSDLIVLLMSSISLSPELAMPRGMAVHRIINGFFAECAHFVAEKSFILWLIDDQGLFGEESLKRQIERAQKMSKGLKHPLIFQYTPSSKIKPLLTFLLSVAGKQG